MEQLSIDEIVMIVMTSQVEPITEGSFHYHSPEFYGALMKSPVIMNPDTIFYFLSCTEKSTGITVAQYFENQGDDPTPLADLYTLISSQTIDTQTLRQKALAIAREKLQQIYEHDGEPN